MGRLRAGECCPYVAGIGFVFSADDPYMGIDFDGCIDSDTGELHSAVAKALEYLDSFKERSPSGTGMHSIVIAELHGDRHRTSDTPWGDKFEVYDRGRFFTVTGNGGGCITHRQAQADALVAKLLPAVTNGRVSSFNSDGMVEGILELHQSLAKIVARKSAKPKDDTPSGWDFKLASHAAELGYDDDTLAALIRHARAQHGDAKGERADYPDTTIRNVRKRVGHITVESEPDAVLDELTRALRVDKVNRRVVEALVKGYGNTATAAVILDNGYAIEFDQFRQAAQPDALADLLSTTVAISTEFTKLQARRIAALIRQAASRDDELHERETFVEASTKLLRIAQTDEFDFDSQEDRWRMWTRLDEMDPEEPPEGHHSETAVMRRNRERQDAEAYGRRMLIPRDVRTGIRFVHSGWFQQFMRLRFGPTSTPQRVKQSMLRSGWKTRGTRGRIKATDPDSKTELPLAFYLIERSWTTGDPG